jgi:ubiquinone/menaquinone biosynthesis C-methylase UbiE
MNRTGKGIYERRVLPRLLDLAMRNREATRYRKKIIPAAAGEVLEIGAGSGLNLPYYTSAVSRLHALDPSETLLGMARKKRHSNDFAIEFLERSAEEIPLAGGSIDTVVTTWTLCTVPDAAKALCEAKRVLKPAGILLFVEHGRSPDASVEKWQRRLDPLWRRVAGGCHLSRKIDKLIHDAGFRIVDLENAYLRGPRPFTYTYCGRARPR